MKVAILTNFGEFVPGYSLTGIVIDQCRMLQKYGHEVSLFVLDSFSEKKESLPPELTEHPKNPVRLVKAMPFGHLEDYRSEKDLSDYSKELAVKISDMLLEYLTPEKCDIVFTHDFIYTGWNLPHSLGIRLATKQLPHLRWLHWIHSVPSTGWDWWNIHSYGNNHRVIFPNRTERIRVAEQFRTTVEYVRVIPHIKDIRTFFDFDKETFEFLDTYPGAIRADVINIYPASTDRLHAKGVDKIIAIMSVIKQMGMSVCLVIANQHATGKERAEDVSKYEKAASNNGLVVGEEFIFTSGWKQRKVGGEMVGRYAVGLPKRILRELMMSANLFIFPTYEESFGLVGPEVSLAGAPLMVLNKSLDMMMEVNGLNGIYCDFGSHHRSNFEPVLPWPQYLAQIAKLIVSRMREQESIRHKSFIRQNYNMDNIYQKYYEPVMVEAIRGWLP